MRKVIQFLILDCKKAAFLITKDQESTLSFLENGQLNLHLMSCKFCALFQKQTSMLSEKVGHIHDNPDETLSDCTLNQDRKATIARKMEEQIKK